MEEKVKKPKTIEEMVNSRTYLLEFQKGQLLKDLSDTPQEQINEVLDTIFYKLFGKGLDDLTTMEKGTINEVLKEYGYHE